MTRKLLLIILLFFHLGCKQSFNENKTSDDQENRIPAVKNLIQQSKITLDKPTLQLVKFEQSKCIQQTTDSLEDEDDFFNEKYLTTEMQLINDTLIVRAIRISHCNTNYIGSVEIQDDTLSLYYEAKGIIKKNRNGTIDTIYYAPAPCYCRYCLTFHVANVTSIPKNIKVRFKDVVMAKTLRENPGILDRMKRKHPKGN